MFEVMFIALIFALGIGLRRYWLPTAHRLWRKHILERFAPMGGAILIVLVVIAAAWNWWHLPETSFSGVVWNDVTIHGSATETGDIIITRFGTGVTRTIVRTVAISGGTIVELVTGSTVLPAVPFFRHTGIAPEIRISAEGTKEIVAENRQFEVSIVGKGESLVLPKESLRRTEKGELSIELDAPRSFRPGKYTLALRASDSGGSLRQSRLVYTKDFTWGVLAFNPNSDIYAPGETGTFQVGVLDDEGVTLCNVEVNVRVTSPSGISQELSTKNSRIQRNPDCKDKTYSEVPDYSGEVKFTERGTYEFSIQAVTPNGVRLMVERISVLGYRLPNIRREAVTRIYPRADYPMRILFTPSHTFTGIVEDRLPSQFRLVSTEPAASIIVDEATGVTTIGWRGYFQRGKTYSLSYVYDPPDVSPEFYLLGPVTVDGNVVVPSDLSSSEGS